MHFSASLSLISQKGFKAGLPARDCWPVPSSVAAPELMRCNNPPASWPVGFVPVTRFIRMVLGPEEGYTFAERNGLAAFFIVRQGQGFVARATPRFEALFPAPE